MALNEEPGVHYLPVELVRNIIKWNAHSWKELGVYSLVSKLWRNATMPFVFEKARIRNHRRLSQLCDLLKSTPEISKYIRRVAFHPITSEDPEVNEDSISLLASLPTFPGVTELEYCDCGEVEAPGTRVTPQLTRFLKTFPYLRRVKIISRFADINQLKAFIGCCGAVKELVLWEGIRMQPMLEHHDKSEGDARADFSSFDLSQLEHLEVFSQLHDFDWILDTILQESRPNKLRSITVESSGFNPHALSRLLEEFSLTLSQLTIEPLWSIESCLRPTPSPFSPLPALHTLTVANITLKDFYHSEENPKDVLLWMHKLIDQLDAANMVVFELVFQAIDGPSSIEEALQTLAWKDLTAHILKRYSRIEELKLRFDLTDAFDQSFGVILQSLVQQYIPASIFGGRRVSLEWTIDFPDDTDWESEGEFPDEPEETGESDGPGESEE
ncbi:hypothetical protein Moror_11680 [Moniliophthora roreri MCA 2997]|uniref:F-box domain-containing protein n=2 Tax=Moniliophthora roreri TaxID=221103 RepID=V2X4M9_MONRO|nr:hypothetical protein Moror_11680 [Moniliophthora roreri MCA 2997]